jgi:hypothetical protein
MPPFTPFQLTLFTNDPALAARADRAGVDRIGIDLDRLGKLQRQNPSYRISNHDPADLPRLRPALRQAKLFARTDPLHEHSSEQIEQLLLHGAEVLMLPMFHHQDEAARFIELVGGRAQVSLLVETAASATRIEQIVQLDGIDEVFVGLNDLHLSLGLTNRFEILVSGLMEVIAKAVHAAGLRLGFGGIGRVSDHSLPVPSSLIYPQYARLGATSALLARSFFTSNEGEVNLVEEVATARRELQRWERLEPATWQQARRDLIEQVYRPRLANPEPGNHSLRKNPS